MANAGYRMKNKATVLLGLNADRWNCVFNSLSGVMNKLTRV